MGKEVVMGSRTDSHSSLPAFYNEETLLFSKHLNVKFLIFYRLYCQMQILLMCYRVE